MTPLGVLLSAASAVLAVPTTVFSLECLLGYADGSERRFSARPPGKRMTILVPAHDEEAGLPATLTALREELAPDDEILVVADNCSDRTAEVARSAGATVVERFDKERRGKGYAVTFGLDALAADPPDVVIIVDADCQLQKGSLELLTAAALESGRPVQADYTMTLPAGADFKTRISVFAFRVRNRVRPRGLARLGGPCHLAGTGMAFPWAILREAMPMGDDLAEDLMLAADLCLRGHYPLLLPQAIVESELAQSRSGQVVQRQRWEQGHLATLRRAVPKLVKSWLQGKDKRSLLMALDIGVPPLTLHVLLLCLVLMAAGLLALLGGSVTPLSISLAQFLLLLVALSLTWSGHGRDVLPLRRLLTIPLYIAWKIPLYLHMMVFGGARSWVRTDRTTTSPGASGSGAHAH
ncbi:MAG TPA: glycosyltransferase family 2 protein [Polyangiaceae bacterium]|nr:glycosyltransferase family 2 protein [Polyangiaceae bacterium]